MRFTHLLATAASSLALALGSGWSFGATFTNSTPITIADNANASLYPSTITVPGSLTITNISVSLGEFAHSRISDLTILLVSPGGRKIQLIANAPGSVPSTLTLGFSDSGRLLNGDPVSKVPYRCTLVPGPQLMPAPAPGLPYGNSFASLIGENAAGTWSLYIRDNVSGVAGQVGEGWSLSINTTQLAPAHSEFSYQGVLKQNGVALSGLFDVKADLWRSPISTLPADLVGSSTSLGVPVSSGVFTTRFAPPESSIISGQGLWIELSVKGPGDASFVKLTPREPITAAPLASYALVAESSDFASTAFSVDWTNITSVPPNVANAFSPWAAAASNAISSTNSGNVLIGTTSGASKLTVNGTIESLTGGIRFPDDTIQTTASLPEVLGGTTVAINFSSITAGGEAAAVINFPQGGLAGTEAVIVNPTSDLPADVAISYARVNSATQIRFVVRNHGAATVDPPLMGFTFRVIR